MKPVGPVIILVLLLAAACSAGDPPDPEEARVTVAPPGSVAPAVADPDEDAEEEEAGEEDEPELSEAEDATLDALEEQFEEQGVKDVRGAPGAPVTIRLEDELTIVDAGPACAAVRAAGFPDVQVDIDGDLAPCP